MSFQKGYKYDEVMILVFAVRNVFPTKVEIETSSPSTRSSVTVACQMGWQFHPCRLGARGSVSRIVNLLVLFFFPLSL